MSHEVFLQCPELVARGVEHGFGTRLSESAPLAELATVRQVHGTDVLRAPLGDREACADALWTSQAGLAVAVHTADCVPILLIDQGSRGVAAVHAGWRGSAARIAEHAVRVFGSAIGAAPRDLAAAVGPHIGPCCYEDVQPSTIQVCFGMRSDPGMPISIFASSTEDSSCVPVCPRNRSGSSTAAHHVTAGSIATVESQAQVACCTTCA
jgi:copper oxidase (laccase) domain-containing protein